MKDGCSRSTRRLDLISGELYYGDGITTYVLFPNIRLGKSLISNPYLSARDKSGPPPNAVITNE